MLQFCSANSKMKSLFHQYHCPSATLMKLELEKKSIGNSKFNISTNNHRIDCCFMVRHKSGKGGKE